MKIREDLMTSGKKFPNFERPDQDGIIRTLEDLMRGWPTILVFWRGHIDRRMFSSWRIMQRTCSPN